MTLGRAVPLNLPQFVNCFGKQRAGELGDEFVLNGWKRRGQPQVPNSPGRCQRPHGTEELQEKL